MTEKAGKALAFGIELASEKSPPCPGGLSCYLWRVQGCPYGRDECKESFADFFKASQAGIWANWNRKK